LAGDPAHGQWNLRDEDVLYGQTSYDRRTFHGRGPAFEAFLLDELKPFIEANYPVDPARAVLFGHSDAGVFATEILARRPDAFSGFLIASPGLGIDPQALPGAARAARTSGPKRVFLAVGAAESPVMVGNEEALEKALTALGSQLIVKSKAYPGARHPAYFTPLFAEAFPWLLPVEDDRRVDASVLAGYAGTYAYPDGRRLRITARGDQLFADMAGYAERELLSVSDVEFRLPDFPVRYRFSGAPADEVTVIGDGPQITARRAP
jgi:pimeloyl-ACP methyl ester carboxylesterase